MTPPAALMRSMAMRAPENCISPYWATGPVIGPAIPILISAVAWPAAINATEALTAVTSFLMEGFIVMSCLCQGYCYVLRDLRNTTTPALSSWGAEAFAPEHSIAIQS